MKFAKYYDNKIKFYNKDDCLTYRLYKKKIKYIIKHFARDIESLNFIVIDDINCYKLPLCCVCLEQIETRQEVLNIGCCNNFMHPCCFIKTILCSNASCPLCRMPLSNILLKENGSLDREILQLLSMLIINMNKIELAYNKMFFKKNFSIINTMAFIKILKKIDKKLHFNITKSFINYNMTNKAFFTDGINHIKSDKKYKYLYNRLCLT